MPIRTLTPEEQAARDLRDKSVGQYVKEGKTYEEAKAIVEANRAPKLSAKKSKKSK